jgi:hypothetical protein
MPDQLMAVNGDGNLVCNLCQIILAKQGEPEEGIPEMIQLHFELFHDRFLKIDLETEGQ